MNKPFLNLLAGVLLATDVVAAEAAQSRRVYFIGNSVTDTVLYKPFAQSVQGMNDQITWGRQMIPGCPLFGLWRAAERTPAQCGFVDKHFGGSLQALRGFDWDAITLQPFDRLLNNADPKNNDDQGDVLYAQKFIDLALQRSPEAQIYIYARWPRMLVKGKGIAFDKDAYKEPDSKKTSDWSSVDPFAARWQAKYTGRWDASNETADYFETLTRILRTVNPRIKHPVLMIPVGHVMFELDKLMQAREVPGYKGGYDLYKDAIHLTQSGSYVVGCTFYATIYQKNPKGFPGQPYGVTDAKLMALTQEIVWKVVSAHPLSGIAPQEPISER